MGRSCIARQGYPARLVSFLLLAIIVLSAVSTCVSGSTPPQQPQVSILVTNRTISQGSGIDISVEWDRNAVFYPIPPDSILISLYGIPGGSLLGTYTIPKTGESDAGAIRQFSGMIPGSVLPAGDVMLIATDPVSGADSRIMVSIVAPGVSYPAFRGHQVMEETFYFAAAGFIVILAAVLGILVVKRT